MEKTAGQCAMATRRSPYRTQPARLQKALADAGLGSRRKIEGWIRDGRVRVNGKLAKLGDRITSADHVRVDGKEVKRRRARNAGLRVIAYNKPMGELVTRQDPEGRPNVFSRLPHLRVGRWIAVGRLDFNTSGLLLFTNDGELANRLMHPTLGLEREYAVRILGEVPQEVLVRLTHGVELDDGPARFEEIVESGGEGANRWFHVLLREGRNREVRRLWEAAGCRVSRLKRVRFGNVILGSRVLAGHWRDLSDEELQGLLELADMGKPLPSLDQAGQYRTQAQLSRKRGARKAGRQGRKRDLVRTPRQKKHDM